MEAAIGIQLLIISKRFGGTPQGGDKIKSRPVLKKVKIGI